MWGIVLYAFLVFFGNETTLHAYVDPSSFGTISQVLFVILNGVALLVAAFFKQVRSLVRKIMHLVHK